MADEFDELQIIIEAQAQEAKKELDQLIDKITKSEQALMSTEKTASGFGSAFSKSISDLDMGGVKKGTKDAETYVKNTAKELAKNLIIEYKVEDMDAQDKIRSLTENITRLNYEAGRSKKMTGSAGDFSNDATTLERHLADLVMATHNAREEVAKEVSGIYEEILSSGKIRIPANALKEIEWGALDGLLKQHLNSHVGTPIETFVEEAKGRLGDIFTTFAQTSKFDMSKPEDQMHVLIGLLQQFRDESAKSPLLSGQKVEEGVYNVIIDRMREVYNVGSDSFKTVSERAQEFGDTVQRVKAQLGDFASEYASKSTFVNSDAITKEITRLQDKIIDLKQKATFEKPASEAYNRAATEAAKAESYIDALKAKLGELSGAISEVDFSNITIRGEGFENELDSIAGAIEAVKQNIKDAFNGDFADYSSLIQGLEENREEMLKYAEVINENFKDDVDIVDSLNEAIAHLKQGLEDASKLKPSANVDNSVSQYSERMQIFEDMVSKARTELKGFWSDFANTGNRFTSIDEIKEKIDELTAKIYDLKNKSLLEDATGKKFEKTASVVAMYEEQIDSLRTKLESLSAAENTTGNSVSAMAVQAEKAQKEVYSLKDVLSMTKKQILENPGKLFENINLAKPKEEFAKLQKDIEQTTNELEKLNQRMQNGYNRSGSKFEKTSTFRGLKADIEKAEIALVDYNQKLADIGTHTHEINWSGIAAKGKQAFDTVKSAISKALGVLKNFIKHLGAKVSDGFKNLTKSASKFDLTSKGLAKSLLKVSNMLKLMITRMALRGVINEAKESFKELIQFSDKVADNYNKLRNAIKYLADSLAALAAPVFSAGGIFKGLGYVFDAIADKIVDFINKINQLLSALLGRSTWIKATKQTKNYAKELDKAGKSAKGALASFDELNNITSQKDSGNNDTGTGGSQFSEVPIDPKWLKFADWLKDMWKKADFTELGALLAEKLATMLDRIPWAKIKANAAKLGKSLATFLNGIWGSLHLANSLGRTLGEALNTAIEFAYAFVENHSFKDFGRFMGTLISSALRTVDWEKLKKLGTMLGQGIADALNAFLRTDAIVQVGGAIGNLIRTVVNLAWKAITEIEWDKLGMRLRQGLNAMLNRMLDIDESGKNGFTKLGETIGELFKGLLTVINEVLGDKETRQKIGRAITDLLNGIDFAGILSQLGQLIINLAKTIGTAIISALKSGEFRKLLGSAALILGGVLLTTFTGKILGSIGAAIGKQLVSNIATSLISSAPALLSTISASFGTVAASFLPVVGVIALVGVAVYEVVKHWEDIKEAAGLFVERTQEHWENLKAWFSTNMPYFSELVKTTFEGIKDCIFGVVISIQEKIALLKNIFDAISPYVKQIFEGVKTVLGNIIEGIKSDINDRIEFIKTAFSNGLTFIKDLIEGVSQAILGGVNGNLDQVYQGFVRVFEAIKKYVSGIITEAKEWGSRIGDNIKQGIENYGILGFGGVTNVVRRYLPGMRAEGGIYKNGRWQPIERYAAGGLPDSGQMFVARENGAELVGSIGRSTAVMNNDQIVASVSEGVYKAVFSAMSGQQSNVTVVLEGDAEGIFRVVRQQGNDFQRRTGRPVFA